MTSLQKEKTFQYQESLPSLPVPPLEQTCNKYLESVRPLLSEEDYLQTDFIVNGFKNGLGKELQKKLLQRAKEKRNWLEKFWEEEGYLRPRYPIAPYINIGGPIAFRDMWPPQEGTQLKRTAIFINATLQVWQQVYRQEFKVQKIGKTPLCMYQFARIFSECRVPGKDVDELRIHFRPAPASSSRHIIVQIKGRFFSYTVLDENYEPYTAPEIERGLKHINDIVGSKLFGYSVGSLTGEERHTWYKMRERLQSLDAGNANHLYEIEKALFIVVLEESDASDDSDVAQLAVAGDCRNRWFDKSFSILAFKTGMFATHCDHCPFEGVIDVDVVLKALSFIREANGEWQGRQDIQNSTLPHELDFVIDAQLLSGISVAVMKYNSVVKNLTVKSFHICEYGKDFPKSQGIHPDTFCQMALQLTYYRMYKKPAPTYETAQTRLFFHGRTDTVRSCTTEAVNWCKAMVDPKEDVNVKAQLLRKACVKHSGMMKDAVSGQAIDRHLLGLSVIAKQEGIPTPQIFLDKAWTMSGGGGNFILSTSCVGFTEIYGACAPMVHDGYGCFYSIEEHRFNLMMSKWKDSQVTDLHGFRDEFASSLRDMRQILQAAKL